MAYSYNHPKPLIDYTVVKKLKLIETDKRVATPITFVY